MLYILPIYNHINHNYQLLESIIMAPPYIPLKARIQLTLFNFITGRAIGDGTVNRGLLSLFMPVTSADPKPKSGVCTADVMIDSTWDLFARIFVPSRDSKEGDLDKRPVVVYFHGGPSGHPI